MTTDGYAVRVYCDHGDKQPRVDIFVWSDGTWTPRWSPEDGHGGLALSCRKCGTRAFSSLTAYANFLDLIRGAGIRNVSIQSMARRLGRTG